MLYLTNGGVLENATIVGPRCSSSIEAGLEAGLRDPPVVGQCVKQA